MRERLHRILREAGPPRRTAAAFALGVFLSFSPLLGLQIAVGFGAALALRLSRAVMFAGLCMNLPWLMVPWYTAATAIGAFLLRAPISTDLGTAMRRLFELSITSPAFWAQSLEIAAPFLLSFLVGSTAGALVLAAIAYCVVARYVRTLPAGEIQDVDLGAPSQP